MTPEEIKYSLNFQYLKLSFTDKIAHYGIAFVFFTLPLLYVTLKIKSIFTNEHINSDSETIWIIIIFSLVGILLFILQRKQLKFKTIKTILSEPELISIIKNVCDEKEWTIYDFGKNYLKIKTFSNLLTSSFGEDISVIIDGNRVLINSKCKLSKRFYLFTNPNNENINIFFDRIKIRS